MSDEPKCTCYLITFQTPWEPAEWEQNPDCPAHPSNKETTCPK